AAKPRHREPQRQVRPERPPADRTEIIAGRHQLEPADLHRIDDAERDRCRGNELACVATNGIHRRHLARPREPVVWTRDMAAASVSLVIPCYNEEDSLPELGAQLDAVVLMLQARGHEVEAIFVDDGSRDRTADILKQLTASRPWAT